jgi:hypothetical protein
MLFVFTLVLRIIFGIPLQGICAYPRAIYLLLFIGGSSRRGGSVHRGVAKKPLRHERVRKERIVERENGTFVETR